MKSLLLKVTALVVMTAVCAMGQSEFGDKPRVEGYRFDFTGGGARAEGMGKAFIAVSDDNTAGSWNPAGLIDLEQPILSLSYGSMFPRGSSDAFAYRSGTDPVFDHDGSIGSVSGLNFVAPIRIKGHPFVTSASYTRNFDQYEEMEAGFAYDIIYSPNNVLLDTMAATVDLKSTLDGGMNSINFSFGTRLYDKLSGGLAVNIFTGNIIRNEILHDTRLDRKNIDLQFFRQDTVITTLDSNSFSGVNFNLGFKYTEENYAVGLVVRTPFELQVETGRSIISINQKNGLTIDDGTDTTYFDEVVAKYEQPLMIGLGLAYKPNEQSIVAADFEYRGYSGKKVKIRESIKLDPGGDNEEIFSEVDPEWNNVFVFRIGGEYMKETGFGSIPIRAGFGIQPLAAPTIDTSLATGSTTATQFSLGSGLWWEHIHLDFAYSYTSYDRETLYGVRHEDYSVRNVPYDQKTRDHHINATFTGYF